MVLSDSLNPFETVGKTWAAIGLAASLFSLIFLMRAIQREDDSFWRGIGIAGIAGAGFSVYGGLSKVLA
jgi:hypothetical protein